MESDLIGYSAIGVGNGQLEWKEVGPLIHQYASQMDISIEMFAPYGTPPKQFDKSISLAIFDWFAPLRPQD